MPGEAKADGAVVAGAGEQISQADVLARLGEMSNTEPAPVVAGKPKVAPPKTVRRAADDGEPGEQISEAEGGALDGQAEVKEGETEGGAQEVEPESAEASQALDTALAEAEARAEAAVRQAQELQAKLNAGAVDFAKSLSVPVEYLDAEAAATLREHATWKGIKAFTTEHRDAAKAEGFVDVVDKDKPNEPPRRYTYAEIEQWRDRADEMLMELSPDAARIRKTAQRQYVEDAAKGRAFRLQVAAAVKSRPAAAASTNVTLKVRPAAGAGKPAAPPMARKAMDAAAFKAAGGGKNAALATLDAMVG